MKILHTADWHLGRTLYGRQRYNEFCEFLNWLLEQLSLLQIDVLLISGDVFDTTTPSNKAQELYYHFLHRASQICRHIIITGGNHDSPTFLNAPRTLLQAFQIQIIGCQTQPLENEVLLLRDSAHQPELLVCAVPYLRDKDIRCAEPGETIEQKNQKLLDGIQQHYAAVYEMAKQQHQKLIEQGCDNIPILAMGHLFATGGKTAEQDGVRELYVGSLARVTEQTFPTGFDYVALGHLHIPQQVGCSGRIRYSGSPIAMGFGEATQTKQVILLESQKNALQISEIAIPCFQLLQKLVGSLSEILAQIELLKQQQQSIWLEIEYRGEELIHDLQQQFNEAVADSKLEILRIRNKRIMQRTLQPLHPAETLEQLTEQDVFERCLNSYQISTEERPLLTAAYQEILQNLQEEDIQADHSI